MHKLHGEEGSNSVCSAVGDGGETAAASRRILYSLECAQPRSLQSEVLCKQDLLRCLEEKHDAGLAAAPQKR